MADLKDSGRIAVGIGPGLSIDAKLGDLTHPALGALGAAGMVGFESRAIDGSWYEARVSDPYAIFWLRREGQPWGFALNSSGWRGTWESLGFLDALEELDEPIDQEALPETGTVWQGEMLDGKGRCRGLARVPRSRSWPFTAPGAATSTVFASPSTVSSTRATGGNC